LPEKIIDRIYRINKNIVISEKKGVGKKRGKKRGRCHFLIKIIIKMIDSSKK